MKRLVKIENGKLLVKGVHWTVIDPRKGKGYMHLCVRYPQFYNPNLLWDREIMMH